MCLNPITIVNPTKYVSLRYKDRYLLQVPCGKCAQCQTKKSDEWRFRLYQEAKFSIENGSFVMLETLTYSDDYLPHISDFFAVTKELDKPCFNSHHLRLFVARLRQHLKRYYNCSNFKYFIASEYGTDNRYSHRPHYHALFFVSGNISPLEFSRQVSKDWLYGRTDGYPWKSAEYVLSHNTFNKLDAGTLRGLQYVTKYIQKSSEYQKQIDKILDDTMSCIVAKFSAQGLDNWQSSSHFWRTREALARHINQFHRQSTELGAIFLESVDVSKMIANPCVTMPDTHFVIKKIPLPTYYLRKIFYERVEVDGSIVWQPTSDGVKYLKMRDLRIVDNLRARYSALALSAGINIDSSALAEYVANVRGRFKLSDIQSFTLENRLHHLTHYNYVNRYDKEWFGKTGLSFDFIGNTYKGYRRYRLPSISLRKFIKDNVLIVTSLENVLDQLYKSTVSLDVGRQKLFEHKQHLSNLLHHCFGVD